MCIFVDREKNLAFKNIAFLVRLEYFTMKII